MELFSNLSQSEVTIESKSVISHRAALCIQDVSRYSLRQADVMSDITFLWSAYESGPDIKRRKSKQMCLSSSDVMIQIVSATVDRFVE
jgi:hypothetical protein